MLVLFSPTTTLSSSSSSTSSDYDRSPATIHLTRSFNSLNLINEKLIHFICDIISLTTSCLWSTYNEGGNCNTLLVTRHQSIIKLLWIALVTERTVAYTTHLSHWQGYKTPATVSVVVIVVRKIRRCKTSTCSGQVLATRWTRNWRSLWNTFNI